jgi:hypothetical protein
MRGHGEEHPQAIILLCHSVLSITVCKKKSLDLLIEA